MTFIFVCDMSKTDWNSQVSPCLSTEMLHFLSAQCAGVDVEH